MTPAFNLVPHSCRLAAQRAARLRRWLALLLLASLGVMLAYLHGQSRRWQLQDAQRQLRQITAEQQNLDRQLNMIARTRQSLVQRARALLEVDQGWPVLTHLSRLYAAIPSGISLTQASGERVRPAPKRKTVRAQRRAAPGAKPAATPPPEPQWLRFELHGYAEDFAALSNLIAALEALDGYRSVRLLRAGREEVRGRTLVGFSLEARIDPQAPGSRPQNAPQVARNREGRP